jgi:phosphodiesterase/alkaline phosphatase D-like protein
MSQRAGSYTTLSRRTFLQAAATVASVLTARRAAAAVPQLLRCPSVQNVSKSGASILWTMSAGVPATVLAGDTAGKSFTSAAAATLFPAQQTGLDSDFYLYQAALTELDPDTAYTYRILVGAQEILSPASSPMQFRTARDGDFEFLHLADCGVGNDIQTQLSARMASENVALVLANGDLAYDLATFRSIEANYYGVYRELMQRIPFFERHGLKAGLVAQTHSMQRIFRAVAVNHLSSPPVNNSVGEVRKASERLPNRM